MREGRAQSVSGSASMTSSVTDRSSLIELGKERRRRQIVAELRPSTAGEWMRCSPAGALRSGRQREARARLLATGPTRPDTLPSGAATMLNQRVEEAVAHHVPIIAPGHRRGGGSGSEGRRPATSGGGGGGGSGGGGVYSRAATCVLRYSSREQLLGRKSLQRTYAAQRALIDVAARGKLLHRAVAEVLNNQAEETETRTQHMAAGVAVACARCHPVGIRLVTPTERAALPPLPDGFVDVGPTLVLAAQAAAATATRPALGGGAPHPDLLLTRASAHASTMRSYIPHSSTMPHNVRVVRLEQRHMPPPPAARKGPPLTYKQRAGRADDSDGGDGGGGGGSGGKAPKSGAGQGGGAPQQQQQQQQQQLPAPCWEDVPCQALPSTRVTGRKDVTFANMVHFAGRALGLFRVIQPAVVPETVDLACFLSRGHPRTVVVWAVASRADQVKLVPELELAAQAEDAACGRPESYVRVGTIRGLQLHAEERVMCEVGANPCAIPSLSAGTAIIARYKGGLWCKARVSYCWGNGVYDVLFDDGKRTPGVPDAHIHVVQQMGTSIKARRADRFNQYYPAMVVNVRLSGTYDVRFEDGTMGYGLKCAHVRPEDKPHEKPVLWAGKPVRSTRLCVPVARHGEEPILSTRIFACTEDGHAHELEVKL